MECKVRSDKLLAWSSKLTKFLAWSAKCSSSIQSYHIKALTHGMEFKIALFHPTKIKIELTSFENWENELFTIFIKKTLTHLELTLGTEVNSIVHCCWCHAVTEGVSCQDCWHNTTTATMWGSGTNVIRPDQTTNFEMKLDYGYTTAPCNTIFSKACWR